MGSSEYTSVKRENSTGFPERVFLGGTVTETMTEVLVSSVIVGGESTGSFSTPP